MSLAAKAQNRRHAALSALRTREANLFADDFIAYRRPRPAR